MKILAINGSPRGRESNTDRILQPFLAGAVRGGCTAETLYSREMKVADCLGCFSCWKHTPGKCVLEDDMTEVLRKIREADVLIWASPLYYFGLTAQLQKVMERTLPLVMPYIVKKDDGHYGHPLRYGSIGKKTILISNCGFPERHYFDAVLEQFRLMRSPLAATILCTGGELLRVPDMKEIVAGYIQAAEKAGYEFAVSGSISEETDELLKKDFLPLETFIAMANASWEVEGEVAPTLEEAMGKTLQREVKEGEELPLPAGKPVTAKDYISGMPLVFRKEAAQDTKAVIAFDILEPEAGRYFVRIENGECKAFLGIPEKADLTIHAPSEIWIGISQGKINGGTALLTGKYYVDGNMSFLMKMGKWFGEKTEV